jgi:hypothetical protein
MDETGIVIEFLELSEKLTTASKMHLIMGMVRRSELPSATLAIDILNQMSLDGGDWEALERFCNRKAGDYEYEQRAIEAEREDHRKIKEAIE